MNMYTEVGMTPTSAWRIWLFDKSLSTESFILHRLQWDSLIIIQVSSQLKLLSFFTVFPPKLNVLFRFLFSRSNIKQNNLIWLFKTSSRKKIEYLLDYKVQLIWQNQGWVKKVMQLVIIYKKSGTQSKISYIKI